MPRAITALRNVLVIPKARRNPYDYVGCTPPTRHHYGVRNHTRINTCPRRWNFLVIVRKSGRRRAPIAWRVCRECLASSETSSSSFIHNIIRTNTSVVPLQILISTVYKTVHEQRNAYEGGTCSLSSGKQVDVVRRGLGGRAGGVRHRQKRPHHSSFITY